MIINKRSILVILVTIGVFRSWALAVDINEKPARISSLIVCKSSKIANTRLRQNYQLAGIKTLKKLGRSGCELVSISKSTRQTLEILGGQNGLVSSLDYIVSGAITPDDSRFSEQWGLLNTGQAHGLLGVDIGIGAAWEFNLAKPKDVIGVIDSGCLYTHPDLAANIWNNPGEIAGNNIDDDGNGYIDDIHGINAITNSGDPRDDNGHGTHVAGIISAATNNSQGVAGVSWNAPVLCCKFLDETGFGYTSDAIKCLDYIEKLRLRKDNPVAISITNNSWGGGDFSAPLRDMIAQHQKADILFVAAAGNSHDNNDETPSYPASFGLSNILSVGAFDNNGKLAIFSNFGKRSVHVLAPGDGILSTTLKDDYEFLSGTSMAAPHASGLAALLKAQNNLLNYSSLKNLIMAGGFAEQDVASNTISGRRILAAGLNGLGALTCADQRVRKRLAPLSPTVLVPQGSTVDLAMLDIICESPSASSSLEMNSPGKSVEQIKLADPLAEGIFKAQWTASSLGIFTAKFPDDDDVTLQVYSPGKYKIETRDYEYLAIAGKNIDLLDESRFTLSSPFPLRFGGLANSFSLIHISDNGAISLSHDKILDFNNLTLPTAHFAIVIAPFWDDLKPELARNIYYEVLGSAPNRKLAIEWRQVPHYSAKKGEGITFQVIFLENSSTIHINYQDLFFGDALIDNGKSATVGIQSSPQSATLFAFQEAALSDHLSLVATLIQETKSAETANQKPSLMVPSIAAPAPLSLEQTKDQANTFEAGEKAIAQINRGRPHGPSCSSLPNHNSDDPPGEFYVFLLLLLSIFLVAKRSAVVMPKG